MMLEVTVPQPDAASACANLGANLPRLNTLAHMDFYRTRVLKCRGKISQTTIFVFSSQPYNEVIIVIN